MKHVYFNSSDGVSLEGIYHEPGEAGAVVIAHPHPLYGGNMYSHVVAAVEKACLKNGYATLRFNFRGVGNSQGIHADGKGEINDVRGAIDYVGRTSPKRVVFAGYSFGAWVGALLPPEAQPDEMIMISPPVAMFDFSGISAIPPLKLVVTGENDDIAPPEAIEKHLAKWNPGAALKTIENCDHFFGSSLPELQMILTENLQ